MRLAEVRHVRYIAFLFCRIWFSFFGQMSGHEDFFFYDFFMLLVFYLNASNLLFSCSWLPFSSFLFFRSALIVLFLIFSHAFYIILSRHPAVGR